MSAGFHIADSLTKWSRATAAVALPGDAPCERHGAAGTSVRSGPRQPPGAIARKGTHPRAGGKRANYDSIAGAATEIMTSLKLKKQKTA